MNKIFIVEDDENIRDIISYGLTSQGFSPMCFENGTGVFEAIKEHSPSLIILDIMMPGESGLDILKKIKLTFNDIAVILLTAKNSEIDKITGLDLGADDYISKPFSILELISRIRAILRRFEKPSTIFSCCGISVDLTKHLATVEGIPVELTIKEFELLTLLLKNGGNVVPRAYILKEIWNYIYEGESRTIDMHIKTLRQKLGDHGVHIKTIRSIGYKI